MGDRGASILAKLKNKAKESKMSFQQCLLLFFEEEFLRRLSLSEYTDNLVLKGGLFIFLLTNFQSRPTADMDFLLKDSSGKLDEVQSMVNRILSIPTEYSQAVQLEFNGIEEIAKQRKYHGVSIHLIGRINRVRVGFNVDIGIGDVVTPTSEKRLMRTQLSNIAQPQITTYSLESVVSEKFDAILQRLELSSRMKDFYDIVWLSKSFDFSGSSLREAILRTLDNRKTPYDAISLQRVLELVHDPDMNTRWRLFTKNFQEELTFPEIITRINIFIEPIWRSIIDETPFVKNWSCQEQVWR